MLRSPGGRYHVTLRAFLEDAQGKRGNAIQYTIHCHVLLMYWRPGRDKNSAKPSGE
jgi:hypothetical protein